MKYTSMIISIAVLLFGTGLAHAETPVTRLQVVYQRAMGGDPRAQFQLASFYEKGQEGLSKDVSYALSWYEESAHNGFAGAMARLKLLGDTQQIPIRPRHKKTQLVTRAAFFIF